MKSQREHWASGFGFIMATAGSTIGLGSLWRFPYISGDNGGGAFVLLYILFTFFIGVPLFIAELVIGRKTQQAPIFAYRNLSKKSQNWKIIGWLNLLTCFIILSFYCVVSGWCLNYAFMSLNQFSLGKTPTEIRSIFETVYTSSDINLFWLLIFILLNLFIVQRGIRKGIEYWSRILTPALFFILIGLFIYGFTMPGFSNAARFILYPNFSKLTPAAVLNALGMSFFTLSVGLGIVLTYGSYLRPSASLPKAGLVVATLTLIVSLMAALTIFPIVFTFNFPPEGGPGLVFQTMPILFAKLPGNLVISTAFFLLLVFTALTSSISLFEVVVANMTELFSYSRQKAMLIAACATFILGIPSALSGSKALFPNWTTIYGKDFFSTMNDVTATWMMPLAGLLTALFIGYFTEKDTVFAEFEQGTKLQGVYSIWRFAVRYLCPIAVILIILDRVLISSPT